MEIKFHRHKKILLTCECTEYDSSGFNHSLEQNADLKIRKLNMSDSFFK
jgi:hypothetical protein